MSYPVGLIICYAHIQDPAAIHIFPEFFYQGIQLYHGIFFFFPITHSQWILNSTLFRFGFNGFNFFHCDFKISTNKIS